MSARPADRLLLAQSFASLPLLLIGTTVRGVASGHAVAHDAFAATIAALVAVALFTGWRSALHDD